MLAAAKMLGSIWSVGSDRRTFQAKMASVGADQDGDTAIGAGAGFEQVLSGHPAAVVQPPLMAECQLLLHCGMRSPSRRPCREAFI
jgi:hypothetical protein